MERTRSIKKRPCKVCRRWFRPDPRVGEDQKTCGRSECKREWHRRSCAEWNKKNREYFKGKYLKKKLLSAGGQKESAEDTPDGVKISRPCLQLGLPWEEIQEVMGVKEFVIIEYIVQLLIKCFKAQIKAQLIVNTT